MKKDILIIFSAILVVAALIMGMDFQSVDEYYLTHIDDIKPDSQTVFLSIDCKTILENYDKLDDNLKFEKYVPKDGIILKKTEYVLRKGDTVFDILSRAVRHNKIQMEYKGANETAYKSAYIEGINYLYELSCGEGSGWSFLVNGKMTEYGCSQVKLKDGDVVEWKYTCNFGEDLKQADDKEMK
ncbi:MAG: DUF4430 domain-containing protein [Ruminococcus sp.]|nr:DUF4430 domain-containing protein [Ruminococcus sp.]